MDAKSLSFTTYDFLGYLIPGALLVLLGDASIAFHTAGNTLTYDSILDRYSNKDISLIFPFIIVAYIVGHLLSFISAASIERFSVWIYGHPSKYLLGVTTRGFWRVGGANRPASMCLRLLMWGFLFPISFLEFIFGYILRLRDNYVSALDPLMAEIIRRKTYALIQRCGITNPKEHGTAEDHDFSKLAMHYALENAPNHVFTLRNYVALYGFLRTVCLVFVFIFWSIALHGYHMNWSCQKMLCFIVPAGVVCFISFISFMKFFQRYHEEGLLAITIASLQAKRSPTRR